ncbi:MAG: hypothetical protein ACLUN5_18930 [Oscillospiraceae bacterium]
MGAGSGRGRGKRRKALLHDEEGVLAGRDAALRFVAGRTYDAAFSYGEWCPLEFVAQNVAARTKAVWIHTDITKSNGFDANAFFDSFLSYRYYIFVSEDTKRRAGGQIPVLIGKSALIHNVLDRAWLKSRPRSR